jgi:hypothetical protein
VSETASFRPCLVPSNTGPPNSAVTAFADFDLRTDKVLSLERVGLVGRPYVIQQVVVGLLPFASRMRTKPRIGPRASILRRHTARTLSLKNNRTTTTTDTNSGVRRVIQGKICGVDSRRTEHQQTAENQQQVSNKGVRSKVKKND